MRRAPSGGGHELLHNLRQPMPLPRKLWLLTRNLGLRLRGRPCCGHPGEPGC